MRMAPSYTHTIEQCVQLSFAVMYNVTAYDMPDRLNASLQHHVCRSHTDTAHGILVSREQSKLLTQNLRLLCKAMKHLMPAATHKYNSVDLYRRILACNTWVIADCCPMQTATPVGIWRSFG